MMIEETWREVVRFWIYFDGRASRMFYILAEGCEEKNERFLQGLGPKQLNKTFDYLIPKNMEKHIKIGSRVFVPFGRIKKQEGFVIEIKPCTVDGNRTNKERQQR